MLKFFRKYNMFFLVGGGSLLMIAFLIGPALDVIFRPSRELEVGTVNGKSITNVTTSQQATHLQVIQEVNPVLIQSVAMLSRQQLPMEPLNWVLMLEEADQLGVQAGVEDVNQLLGFLQQAGESAQTGQIPPIRTTLEYVIMQNYMNARMMGQGLPGTRSLKEIAQRHDVNVTQILVDYIKVAKYIDIMLVQPRQTPRLLEQYAYELTGTVRIEAVGLDAETLVDTVEVTQEEVRELFEKYKNNLPGTGEPYALGYKKPDAVRLEYMVLSLEQVQSAVKIGPDEAYNYYRNHPEEFPRTSINTGDESEEQANSKVEPFTDEIEKKITEQLEAEKTQQLMKDLEEFVLAELREGERILQSEDEQGYKIIPANFQPRALEDVAEEVEANSKFGFYPKVVRLDKELIPLTELPKQEEIGQTFLSKGNIRGPFVYYAASAQGLKAASRKELQPLASLRLQPMVVAEPVVEALEAMYGIPGDHYVFRLLETRKEQPPASLDEVREKVTEDAKRIKAYEQLVAKEAELVKQAEGDMTGLAEAYASTVLTPEAFSRFRYIPGQQQGSPGQLAPAVIDPEIGANQAFVDKIWTKAIDLFRKHDVIVAASPEERVLAINQPSQQKVWVVRINGFTPPLKSQAQQKAMEAGNAIVARYSQIDLSQVFSQDELIKRTGFEWNEDYKKRDEESPEGDGGEAGE